MMHFHTSSTKTISHNYPTRRVCSTLTSGSSTTRGDSVTTDRTLTKAKSSATAEEALSNRKRWEESGHNGSVDSWEWTLNWDEVGHNILIGSCPRTPKDVVELVRSARADAILCLQSDGCFDALRIDYNQIRAKGTELGLVMARVAIWDFNHNDQALMIPEAVRKLALLLAMDKRVYIHCTAGINRATLTVVSYLTFVKGWDLDHALHEVKSRRPQAHPYMDCWHTMRARLTEGRTKEVLRTAATIYEERKATNQVCHGDSLSDWVKAETVIITELFQRQLQADLSMMLSFSDLGRAEPDGHVCLTEDEFNKLQAEMGLMREKAEVERAQARAALAQAARVTEENRKLREVRPDAVALLESSERKAARLKAAEREINALRSAIRTVALAAVSANTGADDDWIRSQRLLESDSLNSHKQNGAHVLNCNGNGFRNGSNGSLKNKH